MFLRSTLMLTKLPRLTHNVVRTCTHQITAQPTQPTQSSSDWNTIYKFPSITFLAKLSKLKIYQSAVTVVGLPVLLGLESFQMVSIQTTQLFVILGMFTLKCFSFEIESFTFFFCPSRNNWNNQFVPLQSLC